MLVRVVGWVEKESPQELKIRIVALGIQLLQHGGWLGDESKAEALIIQFLDPERKSFLAQDKGNKGGQNKLK